MSYETTVGDWNTVQGVEWNLVRDTLAEYLREVVATFSDQNPGAIVYGFVLVSGQNWELSVYLNTEEGYLSMPGRFRQENQRTYGSLTDEEIHLKLGRWYYAAWEFVFYEFKCRPEVNALNDLHYELFNRLSDTESAQEEGGGMAGCFLHACAGAAAVLEGSREIQALQRTDDFEVRLFDANTYAWETAAIKEQARQQIPEM